MISFGFKVNQMAGIPYRTMRDLIFRRMLRRLSRDIGWRKPYSDRLPNSCRASSSQVEPDASASALAVSNLFAFNDRTTRSTSGKFLPVTPSILTLRFLDLTWILKTRKPNTWCVANRLPWRSITNRAQVPRLIFRHDTTLRAVVS